MYKNDQEKFAMPLNEAASACGLSHWTLRKAIGGKLKAMRVREKFLSHLKSWNDSYTAAAHENLPRLLAKWQSDVRGCFEGKWNRIDEVV